MATRKIAQVLVILLIMVAVASAIGVYVVTQTLFSGAATEAPDVVFQIESGENLRVISTNLEGSGLIRSARALELFGRIRGYDRRLQAGRYIVSASMTPVDILTKIVEGDADFDEIIVTIPEGWSIDEIEQHLEEIGLFTVEVFQEAVVMQDAYRDFDFLTDLEDDTILDGYLFPDTYRVLSDSTPVQIVRRMLTAFDQRISEDLRSQIESQGRTLRDVLILASIVQEEAGGVQEMPPVAGVFWNRLEIWMPLESDATVNYVLGTSKRQPTFADTKVEDPYNTYVNYGLPPGPIGNPGLDAIRAAIEPQEHDYLFFLHPLGGDIVLSRTYAEHLENKARYLD